MVESICVPLSVATRPRPLIEAPLSNAYRTYETLGYIEAHDEVLNSACAFVVFRETDRLTGAYIVRVASKGTAGATFDRATMRTRSVQAHARNEPYFTWGYSFTPSVDDLRQIEFRVHQSGGVPTALEIFVVTRNADGSAQPAKSLLIENFIADSLAAREPLITAPVSNALHAYKILGYLEAYDAVLNCDYALVAYREQERATGQWRICIKSTQTPGGSFDPAAIRMKAREIGARGGSYFPWGYHFEPTADDPRQIEFRVYVADSRPREVEIFVRLRQGDHSADQAKSVRFTWPEEI